MLKEIIISIFIAVSILMYLTLALGKITDIDDPLDDKFWKNNDKTNRK